jgi:hypothetical protein
VALGAADQRRVLAAQPARHAQEHGVVGGVAGIDEKRDARRPAIGGVQDVAHDVEVLAQDVVVVGL